MLKIAEIFHSLQGEGFNAGKPAVFVRLAGCNLKCHFCDTDFRQTEKLTEEEVLNRALEIAPKCRFVVLTGGEPLLQNLVKLTRLLSKNGYFIAVETNGTILRDKLAHFDWITVSPKKVPVTQNYGDELKVIDEGQSLEQYPTMNFRLLYLQPVFVADKKITQQNIQRTVQRVKENPQWSLSIQSHKLIAIP